MTAARRSRVVVPLWVREISGFLTVGGTAFLTQVSLLNLLVGAGVGVLTANAAAFVCSATVGYLGNRYLSFRHRAATSMAREAVVFALVNLATLVLLEAILSLSYLTGSEHDRGVINVLNIVGTAIGTVLRLVAYRRFVFVTPPATATEHCGCGQCDPSMRDEGPLARCSARV